VQGNVDLADDATQYKMLQPFFSKEKLVQLLDTDVVGGTVTQKMKEMIKVFCGSFFSFVFFLWCFLQASGSGGNAFAGGAPKSRTSQREERAATVLAPRFNLDIDTGLPDEVSSEEIASDKE
jgi:hypothetical protein